MSRYGNNAAPPPKPAAVISPIQSSIVRPSKRPPPTATPADTPGPKKAKLVEQPDDGDSVTDVENPSLATEPGVPDNDADATQPYDADETDSESGDHVGLNSRHPGTADTTVNWLPDLARLNYIKDPFKSLTNVDWYYSNSMKGWIRAPCLLCGNFLNASEMTTVGDAHRGLPQPLARDTRTPPAWKTRLLCVCNGCQRDVKTRLAGNPQNYNGKGTTIWVMPS